MDDLHIHSTYSDGLCSIEELRKKTKSFGMFSITDHNNIEASKQINDTNFTTGVELTTSFLKEEYHILGYNFDPFNDKLNHTIDEYNHYNNEAYKKAFKKIASNLKIEPNLIDTLIEKKVTLNKVSLTKLLSKELNNPNLEDIYTKYVKESLESIKPYYISPQIITSCIKDANGYLIIAHPFISCKNNDVNLIIKKFLQNGGDGIELNKGFLKNSLDLINYYQCLFSIGSDYYGDTFDRNNTLGVKTAYFNHDKKYIKNMINK